MTLTALQYNAGKPQSHQYLAVIAQIESLKIAEHAATMTEPALLLAGLISVVICFGVVTRFLVNAFLKEHARLVEQYASLVEHSRQEREDCTNKRETLHAERKSEIAALTKVMEDSANNRAQIVLCISANTAQAQEVAKVLALVKDRLEKTA